MEVGAKPASSLSEAPFRAGDLPSVPELRGNNVVGFAATGCGWSSRLSPSHCTRPGSGDLWFITVTIMESMIFHESAQESSCMLVKLESIFTD